MKRQKNQSRTPTPKFLETNVTVSEENFDRDEVCAILKFARVPVQAFFNWMDGQTCPMLPNGKMGYFRYDLTRFLRWKTQGIVPVWD